MSTPAIDQLRQELQRGGRTDNLLQAVYNSLSSLGVQPGLVDHVLALPTESAAYTALATVVTKAAGPDLPADLLDLLRQALRRVARHWSAQRATAESVNAQANRLVAVLLET